MSTPSAPAPVFMDDRLAWWAKADPDGEAITYGGRTWTWASGTSGYARGRRPAARSASAAATSWRSSTRTTRPASRSSLGAGSLGAANAIVNWRSAGDEVDYAVNDSGAKVLFVGTELMPVIEKIRDRLTKRREDHRGDARRAEGDEYEAWLAASEPVDRVPTTSTPDDVCLVMYSSGTTGRPKGVMLTHTNMVAHTENAHDGWGFEDGDKVDGGDAALPRRRLVVRAVRHQRRRAQRDDPRPRRRLAGRRDHERRQPDVPGAGRAGAGAAGRAGRGRSSSAG